MKASRRIMLCVLALTSVALVFSVGVQATTGPTVPPGLLLWNKLGSADEVTHSEYGPDLVMFNCTNFSCGLDVPGTLGYPAGVSGGAASITGGPYFPGARVHTAVLRQSILNPERGAIEAWYRQASDPVPFAHNPHRIFGGAYSITGIDEANLFSWDQFDSGNPRLHFSLFFNVEPPPFTPAHLVGVHSLVDGAEGYRISQFNGSWIHVAGVWDRSGIAGTSDTIRLYVNGAVVATSHDASWGTATCDKRLAGTDRCFTDVAGCNDTCADTFAVDELKLWDYAKTDYTDSAGPGHPPVPPPHDKQFTTIDAPNAVSTQASGINAVGDVVGIYADGRNIAHGFVLHQGTYSTIDDPNALLGTRAFGINLQGDVVGSYLGCAVPNCTSPRLFGFLMHDGTYTTIDHPNAVFSTDARGINARGDVVGTYRDGAGSHGYLLHDGQYTTIDQPNSLGFTTALGINAQGDVVGSYRDGAGVHGYLLHQGAFTTIDHPAAVNTAAVGIDERGDVVGTYLDGTGQHGFLLDQDGFTTIDSHGARFMTASGLNARGDVVGTYFDGTRQHGFLLSR
jgi:uncharacterized membrane protein